MDEEFKNFSNLLARNKLLVVWALILSWIFVSVYHVYSLRLNSTQGLSIKVNPHPELSSLSDKQGNCSNCHAEDVSGNGIKFPDFFKIWPEWSAKSEASDSSCGTIDMGCARLWFDSITKKETKSLGSAAVSVPQQATSGETFTVYLRVSPRGLTQLIKSLKDDFKGGRNNIGKEKVWLTPKMIATVDGTDFEVTPKDGYTQAVSSTDLTTWSWQVKALRAGELSLMFKLAGTVNVAGKDVPRDFYQYEQQVTVTVGWLGFFESNWQWLITVIILPAIGGLWTFFRRPKDSGGVEKPSIADRLRERRLSRKAR